MNMLIEIIGWFGTGLILIAYWLVSGKRVGAKSALYQSFNLAGAMSLFANALYHKAFPLLALNVVWVAIAVWALLSGQKEKRN